MIENKTPEWIIHNLEPSDRFSPFWSRIRLVMHGRFQDTLHTPGPSPLQTAMEQRRQDKAEVETFLNHQWQIFTQTYDQAWDSVNQPVPWTAEAFRAHLEQAGFLLTDQLDRIMTYWQNTLDKIQLTEEVKQWSDEEIIDALFVAQKPEGQVTIDRTNSLTSLHIYCHNRADYESLLPEVQKRSGGFFTRRPLKENTLVPLTVVNTSQLQETEYVITHEEAHNDYHTVSDAETLYAIEFADLGSRLQARFGHAFEGKSLHLLQRSFNRFRDELQARIAENQPWFLLESSLGQKAGDGGLYDYLTTYNLDNIAHEVLPAESSTWDVLQLFQSLKNPYQQWLVEQTTAPWQTFADAYVVINAQVEEILERRSNLVITPHTQHDIVVKIAEKLLIRNYYFATIGRYIKKAMMYLDDQKTKIEQKIEAEHPEMKGRLFLPFGALSQLKREATAQARPHAKAALLFRILPLEVWKYIPLGTNQLSKQ